MSNSGKVYQLCVTFHAFSQKLCAVERLVDFKATPPKVRRPQINRSPPARPPVRDKLQGDLFNDPGVKYCYMAPMSLAITRRWISLVPSPIVSSF